MGLCPHFPARQQVLGGNRSSGKRSASQAKLLAPSSLLEGGPSQQDWAAHPVSYWVGCWWVRWPLQGAPATRVSTPWLFRRSFSVNRWYNITSVLLCSEPSV